MIVLPLTLAIIFGIIIFQTVGKRYWVSIQQMYKDDNGVYSAQSLLYAYTNDIINYEWRGYGTGLGQLNKGNNDIIDSTENSFSQLNSEQIPNISSDNLKPHSNREYINQTNNIEKLESEMINMGYHIKISKNNKELYSNMNNTDLENVALLLPTISKGITNSVISNGSTSLIKMIVKQNRQTLEIIAVSFKTGESSFGKTYIQKYITFFIFAFIAFLFFSITIISFIITRETSVFITKPLNQLKKGTKAISEGQLDTKINYSEDNEFGEVCKAFNEMGDHLKSSVEEQLKNEEYMKNMIAGISHDLRTPLTSIRGYTEGLKEGIANSDDKKKRYYESILTRSNDMERLLDNLSTLSRLEYKSLSYNFQATNLGNFIEKWILNHEMDFAKKNVSINFRNFCNKKELMIDRVEINRVLSNLLDNSIKYNESGNLKINITLRDMKDSVKLLFSDNGPGISEENLSKIFDRFYREDSSRTKSSQGNGLGLSIVKQIIIAHRGQISAVNDNGLKIIIELPLKDVLI